VEYSTTRKIGATPWKGVAEIHAAFADPQIMAIMAISGGDDQIKVLRGLEPLVLQANPKAFFGYSDNTNLLVYLWNLGIMGFYGGSTMVQLARMSGASCSSRCPRRCPAQTTSTSVWANAACWNSSLPWWWDADGSALNCHEDM